MNTVKKICYKHGETTYSIHVDGRARCRKCMYQAVKRRRYKVKRMAIEYKGGCCNRCGYDKCDAAMDFHHTDATKKDFQISGSNHNKSWDKVKVELDKCELLCSNCHREEHDRISKQVD